MTPVAAAKRIVRLNGEVRQFSILTQHFFNRFFRNDVVDFEDQMKEKLITGMVFLTILGGHIANSILMKYIFLLDDPDSWVEKSYFIFFFMALLGFITVIEWDVIFPDGRDYFNLVPLPVRVRTFFFAKFASFSLFIAAYSVAVNALGGFAFAFYLSQFHSPGVGYFLRYFLAHVISVSAACAFIFLLCVLIQGLLMCCLSYHRFRKISGFSLPPADLFHFFPPVLPGRIRLRPWISFLFSRNEGQECRFSVCLSADVVCRAL